MAIAWWKDTGLYAKMFSDLHTNPNHEISVRKLSEEQPLFLSHVQAAFIVWGAGLVISTLVMFLERKYDKSAMLVMDSALA